MQNSMQRQLQRLWQGSDERWRFFRQWLRHPRATAAISPSGPHLVRSMMAEMPVDARRVIELGPGTGAMTRAILARGVKPDDLLLVELNPDMCQYMHNAFPMLRVCCADARELVSKCFDTGFSDGGAADVVLSSLGLLSMPRDLQFGILKAAFDSLAPKGCFIQFTYGPTCPVPSEILDELGVHATRGATVLRNVPPATVFVFRRNRSRAIVPRSTRF